MFCNKCGQEIPENATFCTTCGNKIEQPQQNVNQQPNVQQPNVQQVPQMPNQNFQQVNPMPTQNVNTAPSPLLKWFESAKDVVISFFKKGYGEKPVSLLKENNHMWLLFAVAAVVFGSLSELFYAISTHAYSKFPHMLDGFCNSAAMFFAFATMIFVIAKIAKNDNVSYINALNTSSVAYVPVLFASVANCIVGLVSTKLSYNVEIAAEIMFFVLLLSVIDEVVKNSKYQGSFWFKSLAILCPYLAYKIVDTVVSVITSAMGVSSALGDLVNLFS